MNQKNGKTYWKRWTEDPWSKVKNVGYTKPVEPETASTNEVDAAIEAIAKCADMAALVAYWKALNANAKHVASEARVIAEKDNRKAEIEHREAA